MSYESHYKIRTQKSEKTVQMENEVIDLKDKNKILNTKLHEHAHTPEKSALEKKIEKLQEQENGNEEQILELTQVMYMRQ